MSQFTSDSLNGWGESTGNVFVPLSSEKAEPVALTPRSEVPKQLAKPSKASTRYNSLDLWRGAACLMLMLYHATFYGDYNFRLGDTSTWSLAGFPLYLIRYCWIGVPVFFVISGYCIAASVESQLKRRASLKDYFIRRIRRIYPPLWIMCGVAIIYTWTVTSFPAVRAECHQLCDLSSLSLGQWLGNFMAAESWRHNLMVGEPKYLMANTWTLCYEEQFYLVTGLVLAIAPRRFFQATAWLTVGIILSRHVLAMSGHSQEGFFWDGHWIMFAAGILVYRTLNFADDKAVQRFRVALGVFAIGVLYAAVNRVIAKNHFDKHLAEYVFIGCSFAIALLYLRRWDKKICSHWVVSPLRWCGQRSYSIYLTHFLIVVSVSSLLAYGGLRSEWQVATIVVPVCCLLSLPVAIVFYECIERRFTNSPISSVRPEKVALANGARNEW